MKSLWGYLLSGTNLVALCVTGALASAGLIAHVVVPDSLAIMLGFFAACAAFPTWVTVTTFLGKPLPGYHRAVGILTGCMMAPALISVPVTAVHLVGYVLPPYRDAMAVARDSGNSFFSGLVVPGAEFFILPLIVWLAGGLVTLALVLLLLLPILALRRPEEAAAGSNIEQTAAHEQRTVTRLVFVGMSPLMLGIALWVASDDGLDEFPAALRYIFSALTHGATPSVDDILLALGVLLVSLGTASVVTGIVIMIRGTKKTGT